MKTRITLVVLGLVVLLVGAACGGGDDTGSSGNTNSSTTAAATTAAPGSEDSATTTTAAGSEAPTTTAGAPAVGEAGSFTINGDEFAVTFLNRCIPVPDTEGNIDLQALAQGSGAKLNLYLTGGAVDVSVDGSGVRDTYGSIAFGKDPDVHESEVNGDRWTGSATVGDSLESGVTVDITWDVMVPAEAVDCSL